VCALWCHGALQVDILTWRNKNARIHAQIKDICAILCGLVVASDYKAGQRLIQNRNFADLAEWFQVGSGPQPSIRPPSVLHALGLSVSPLSRMPLVCLSALCPVYSWSVPSICLSHSVCGTLSNAGEQSAIAGSIK
jgi:Protein of unknown function (DUF2009)